MKKKHTNIIALIPAKKNSRGLKNKNLKKLNKLSLVELAILGAKKSKLIDKIYLSSDSDRILDIGAKLNIDVIKRKKFLSTNLNAENEVENFIAKLIDDDEFNKFALLRDQELELHFQHLKIDSIKDII